MRLRYPVPEGAVPGPMSTVGRENVFSVPGIKKKSDREGSSEPLLLLLRIDVNPKWRVGFLTRELEELLQVASEVIQRVAEAFLEMAETAQFVMVGSGRIYFTRRDGVAERASEVRIDCRATIG